MNSHYELNRRVGPGGNTSTQKISSCFTLGTYNKTPIFIPLYITEDTLKLVAQKPLGSYHPGGTDSEYLQGWLLKFGEDIKRIRHNVETSADYLANKSLPWEAYREFMSVRLIAFDKQSGVRLFGVRETWRCIFSEIVIKFTGPEATMSCQYD